MKSKAECVLQATYIIELADLSLRVLKV